MNKVVNVVIQSINSYQLLPYSILGICAYISIEVWSNVLFLILYKCSHYVVFWLLAPLFVNWFPFSPLTLITVHPFAGPYDWHFAFCSQVVENLDSYQACGTWHWLACVLSLPSFTQGVFNFILKRSFTSQFCSRLIEWYLLLLFDLI